jgi:hypothetical protein
VSYGFRIQAELSPDKTRIDVVFPYSPAAVKAIKFDREKVARCGAARSISPPLVGCATHSARSSTSALRCVSGVAAK